MRYRRLDANDDYSFGHGQSDFLINSPAAVAQSAKTRLRLWLKEWFLDQTEGTPWLEDVVGRNTQATRDIAIRTRILQTDGMVSIADYTSTLDSDTQGLTVSCTLNTIYGSTEFSTVL
jgi:hypothetical protein